MTTKSAKIKALRRMTVANGCTPAEAASAKEIADRLMRGDSRAESDADGIRWRDYDEAREMLNNALDLMHGNGMSRDSIVDTILKAALRR